MGLRWPTVGEKFAFSSSCSRSLVSPDAVPRGWNLRLRPPIPPLERRSNNATRVGLIEAVSSPNFRRPPQHSLSNDDWSRTGGA